MSATRARRAEEGRRRTGVLEERGVLVEGCGHCQLSAAQKLARHHRGAPTLVVIAGHCWVSGVR